MVMNRPVRRQVNELKDLFEQKGGDKKQRREDCGILEVEKPEAAQKPGGECWTARTDTT